MKQVQEVERNSGGHFNFAQAALVVAGGAEVYGRKVDYVHQLTLGFFEQLSEKARRSKKGSRKIFLQGLQIVFFYLVVYFHFFDFQVQQTTKTMRICRVIFHKSPMIHVNGSTLRSCVRLTLKHLF